MSLFHDPAAQFREEAPSVVRSFTVLNIKMQQPPETRLVSTDSMQVPFYFTSDISFVLLRGYCDILVSYCWQMCISCIAHGKSLM